jgi:hypothetical protein
MQVYAVHCGGSAWGWRRAKGFRLSLEKMWGSGPFWGLGYDWDLDLAEDEAKEPIGR